MEVLQQVKLLVYIGWQLNKQINMKNIFYILLLLPTIIFAQYPNNSGHKITLGEQTTADGLIYRGRVTDTTLTVKSDTAAYFVLDTANLNLYTYKASATGRKWRQLGADTASIAYVNTYGTQTVNGAKTFSSTVTGARFDPTSSNASGNGMYLPAANSLGFSTAGVNRMTINSSGFIGINGASTADVIMNILSNANGFNLFLDKSAGFGAVMQMRNTSSQSTGLFRVINSSNTIISEYTPTTNGINFSIGNLGVNSTTTSAFLQLGSGTSSTAPLKFTSQTNLLNTPEMGAVEFSTGKLYFSPASGAGNRKEIAYAENFVDLTTNQLVGGTKTFTSNTLNVSDSNGAGFANFGNASGRNQYQYNNFGGGQAGEYGWQFGRSASNGFLPDAYFIYNIRKNNVALGIDTNSNVGIGTNFSMPTQKLHVVGSGLFTGNVGIGSATPTTSGSGITFPAAQSASTNINTLDDYEEGFFSVQLRFGGNNTGYTFYGNAGVFGKYTKIGDVVCVTIMVGILSKAAGASTGNATITGLPFTSASNGVNLGGGINISNAISIDGASFYMTSNSTTLVLQNGNGVNLTDANFGAFLGEIHMNFVYQVN